MASSAPTVVRSLFDWSVLGTLHLRARAVADGVYAGMHSSLRKGSGVEFGGHRAYVPGDDLRLLDRRATLRHDRLIVRELQTETDRTLGLLVDASASMRYQGDKAPVSKFAFASALAAALARVALRAGDPVALELLGGEKARSLPASSGREAFERLVAALETVEPAGDLFHDLAAADHALATLARRARRGSILVLLSDLIDTHPELLARYASLGTGGKTILVVQVLDPDEATLPFVGPLRLRAMEGTFDVETDADAIRPAYLERLGTEAARWSSRLAGHGGGFLTTVTTDNPIEVVRSIVRAAAGGAR